MQISDNPVRYKEKFFWLLKIMVTVSCLWFVGSKLSSSEYPPVDFLLDSNILIVLGVMVLLMPLNWYLEIQKWRFSVANEDLSFKQGMYAVLSGLALNWVFPFTLGDIGGRLANVKNYKQSGIALMLTRVISVGITSAYGGVALIQYFGLSDVYYFLIALGLLLLLIGVRRIYNKSHLKNFRRVVGLTFFRYFVFTIQFALIIWAVIPALSVESIFGGVGWVFFFRSIVPSIFGNFGVREASALIYFERFLDVPTLILVPCLLIWLINTVIPSIVGAFFIFKLKLNIAQ